MIDYTITVLILEMNKYASQLGISPSIIIFKISLAWITLTYCLVSLSQYRWWFLKPLCGILFNTLAERKYRKFYLTMARHRIFANNYIKCIFLIISLIFFLLNITQYIQLAWSSIKFQCLVLPHLPVLVISKYSLFREVYA